MAREAHLYLAAVQRPATSRRRGTRIERGTVAAPSGRHSGEAARQRQAHTQT